MLKEVSTASYEKCKNALAEDHGIGVQSAEGIMPPVMSVLVPKLHSSRHSAFDDLL